MDLANKHLAAGLSCENRIIRLKQWLTNNFCMLYQKIFKHLKPQSVMRVICALGMNALNATCAILEKN